MLKVAKCALSPLAKKKLWRGRGFDEPNGRLSIIRCRKGGAHENLTAAGEGGMFLAEEQTSLANDRSAENKPLFFTLTRAHFP